MPEARIAKPPPMPPAAPAQRDGSGFSLEVWLKQVTGLEATGFAMSFTLHLCLLLVLAVLVLERQRSGTPAVLTITTEQPHTTLNIETIAEFELPETASTPLLPAGPVPMTAALTDPAAEVHRLLAGPPPGGPESAEQQSRPASRAAVDPRLPKNAVQMGSFAAWWIPLAERYGEKVEPGQSPRVGQKYYIYVQIRVPGKRPVFRLDDLQGEIVGTDGYRQLIPDRAWVFDEQGKLVKSVGRSSARVIDGVVQIVFKVEGAGAAGIRDTIRIRSRSLDEEQSLVLEFQALETASTRPD